MDLATKEVGSIHSSDGSLGILSLLKRDKREPSWLAAMRIVHYLCFLDLLQRDMTPRANQIDKYRSAFCER